MSRRKTVDDTLEADPALTAPDEAGAQDTEGHSTGLLLGMMALQEADRASQRDRDRHRQAEDVKPITKSFPNLRQAAIAEAEAARTENDGAGATAPGALPEPSAP